MNSLQLLSLANVFFVVLITIVLLKRKNADSVFNLIPRWSIISIICMTIGTSTFVVFFFQTGAPPVANTSFMRQVPEQGTGAPDDFDVNRYGTWNYRVDAHSPAQYNDLKELKYWQSSVCGVCALTGVLNSYGQSLSLHDMVSLGSKEKVLSKEEGLASEGLKKLAALKGFSSNQLTAPSLEELVTFANAGYPIITLFPEEKYPGGHFIVITGGDKDNLIVADSSRWNRRVITQKWFLKEWDGHSAWLVRPNAPKQRPPNQTLSEDVVPINYDLTFKVDLKRNRFRCSEIIELDQRKPISKLQLDSVGLAIEKCYLSKEKEQSKAHITDDFESRDGRLNIRIKQEIPAGKYFLHIDYSDIFSSTLDGFYVSHYKGFDGAEEKIIGALLEPTSARKMFPCFDDPALKASYKLQVTLDGDLTAISNSPVESQKDFPDTHSKTVTFARSPRMSTYLLQLVIGHLEATPPVSVNGVSVKVWTKRQAANLGLFARDNAAKILNYYTDYFGSSTKWTKLDLIAMPNYEDGAMESPGAMTFGYRTILLDLTNDHDAVGKQPGILQYLTHELSHLWFGDSVTLKSWNDLWLNESFATWMSVKATAYLHPGWHFESELLKWRSHIMEMDALPSAPALRQAILESSFLSSNYSVLVYSKGASIVAMLEKVMGEDNFCRGIKHYIATFADSNASTEDFCQAMSASSKYPVTEFVNSWLSTPGFPLLWLHQDGAAKIFCEQKRFLAIASPNLLSSLPDPKYHLPTKFDLSTPASLAKSLENAQLEDSYCRFGFDNSLKQKLFSHIENFSTAEKFTLVSDSFALMLAGKIDPAEYFAVLKALRENTPDKSSGDAKYPLSTNSNSVLELECSQFAILSSLIEDESVKKQLSEFVSAQLLPSFKRINSFEKNQTLKNLQSRSIRSVIYLTLGVYGGDKDILTDAQTRLNTVSTSNDCKMQTGMFEAICSVVAFNGAAKDYETLATLYSKNSKSEVRTALLKGLCEFPQSSVISNLVEESLKGVEREDAINILHDELINSVNQKVAFSLLKNKWATAQSNLGDPQTSYLLWEMSKTCRFQLNRELKSFIDKNAFLNQNLDRQMVDERLDARDNFHRNIYKKLQKALFCSAQ